MDQLLEDRILQLVEGLGLDRKIIDIARVIDSDSSSGVRTQAIYLFTQTEGNQASVFGAADRAITTHLTDKVLIVNGNDKHGFPGYEKWFRALQGRPSGGYVESIPSQFPDQINTLTESIDFLNYMERQGLSSAYVTAPPFHLLRAFMTAVSVAINKNVPYKTILGFWGEHLSWSEEVYHSQGKLKATRADLIAPELERIKAYTAKGDLLPASKIMDYVEQRSPRIINL